MLASNKLIIGITIAFLVGIAGVVALRETNRPSEKTENSQPQSSVGVPDLTLQDFDGNEIALRSIVGTPLVINSWAVWCPFCKKEIPDLVSVQKEFKDHVMIIAVDRAEPLEAVKEYTDELGVTDDLMFLFDPSDSFYRAIGGFAMSETIFVDTNGAIQFHKRGPMSRDEIRERMQTLINASSTKL